VTLMTLSSLHFKGPHLPRTSLSREYYAAPISTFLIDSEETILGHLTKSSEFAIEQTQTHAWREQIRILKEALRDSNLGFLYPEGAIYFEYAIPRMGKRVDVMLLLGSTIFVIEFKVGEQGYPVHAIDQVMDYALDLKHFHEPSHNVPVAPVLVATQANYSVSVVADTKGDGVLQPILTNGKDLTQILRDTLSFCNAPPLSPTIWRAGRYCPTPTIVEAALALYSGHSVEAISRSDADAINLSVTSKCLDSIITNARTNKRKVICFVTGVPGAGKTLVGLDIATKHNDPSESLYSVFLSGNGPLVKILHEALARDAVSRAKQHGMRIKKGEALSRVKAFIQNVHHFRDECLRDPGPPAEHVALFDEAQRAWDLAQTAKFMETKKGRPGFQYSEPDFLISCMDRHQDWAVIVCLVGGGQEINTGEAGISGWIDAIVGRYQHWDVHISSNLTDSEYSANSALEKLAQHQNVLRTRELHLGVSMRSFRAENVALWVKQVLDNEPSNAIQTFAQFRGKYSIALTRDVTTAKSWLREQARGSERFGIVVSSQAHRLKPYAMDVKTPMDPVHWFLDGKEDVRSSYFLEDVATEFQVQGLELDWACITWDADFQYTVHGWRHSSFVGDRWNRIHKPERQAFQKNAYRVLLTRARQGMVIVVPRGDTTDHTRLPEFYDGTYEYLKGMGLRLI
jgi:DUF2075 family protein